MIRRTGPPTPENATAPDWHPGRSYWGDVFIIDDGKTHTALPIDIQDMVTRRVALRYGLSLATAGAVVQLAGLGPIGGAA